MRNARLGLIVVPSILAALAAVWATVSWRALSPIERGRAAYARGDWEAAAAHARGQLAIAPGEREARRLLARSSARLGRDDEARELYRRLGTSGAEAEDYLLLAEALRRSGDAGQAMLLLERGNRLDPRSGEVLHALTSLYLDTDFLLAALPMARKLAAHPGWDRRGRWLLGRVLLAGGDAAAADDTFAGLRTADPEGRDSGLSPPEIRKLAARAALRAGRPGSALAALGQDASPAADPEAAWLRSRAFLQRGEAAAAAQALGRTSGASPGDFGPEPAPAVGSARCASCHAAIARSHREGRHAHTFAAGNDLAEVPLPAAPVADPGDPTLHHAYHRAGTTVEVEARREGSLARALAEYALGSGHRGQTLVVRDASGLARESRLTHFAAPGVGWSLTMHHPAAPPPGNDALGQPLIEDFVRHCIRCHVSDAGIVGGRVSHEEGGRGIGCERCHGPGGNHVKAVELDFAEAAILQPGRGSADRRAAHCGGCHDAPRGAVESAPDFVRFAYPNLRRSRCFTESRALDCTSCHDPHRDAETDAEFYVARCLACHGRATADPPRSTCPVDSAKDCLRCHMPSVEGAIPGTRFTDHFIRVRGDRAAP